MCITLNLPDGKYAKVITELDAALGWRAPIKEGYAAFSDGDRDCCCLCPVDMKELSRLTSWTIEAGDFDPMELVASIPLSRTHRVLQRKDRPMSENDKGVVSVIDGVTRLSDGSGFFVMTVGERSGGFISWLKAHPDGRCRKWLFLWRNFRTARTDWGTEPHLRKLPMLRAIRWAWDVSR